ncbi:TPA: carbamoyltransferase HypF [Aeromonas salmonicida]|uniref:carbamoyltransferase HypF n=1 Tax=Aeromonas salmonicida TaxID=645 RepID=UPI00285EF203|nr:carbamoyltransferase HypF [Aeromonas salmonicida]MDR6993609.1 hydrogenase maturation protein HypF [Aeromonas salmonicida]HEH9415268.1 carbamoyltransferase HypF [Aeromonas salmonicida]HEH9424084.1 carbamoyltransferase HypF [Aeromonas salmonicida]HEH9437330.1 carbamoyltransferase HypF [Aeromonas salmonicida]
MTATRLRREFHIDGIVQGVGFRPFVYGLALRHALTGYVLNDASGVTIGAEGSPEQLAAFARELRELAPPLSRIDHFSEQVLPQNDDPDYDGQFHIKASQQQSAATVAISPDQGMCEGCARDVANPADRHHHYPFTNCTHCGPRYTIIRRLPYDRPHTAMADFAMCPRCAAAYEDPLDRRYHAQPVSCPECGPHLSWRSGRGDALAEREDALHAAARALQTGALIAVKGIGGYHLICDARSESAVARLRQLKRRARKPLAVMMGSLAEAKLHVTGCEAEWSLLSSQARPITLLRKRKNDDRPSESQHTAAPLAEGIAPGIPYLGVMLPYTPLHQLLLDVCAIPLVATSANGRGSPILIECESVVRELGGEIDGILDHNRPILHPCDDSLVQWAGGRRQTLRLARGYAPCTPSLKQAVKVPLLAVGAQQKNQLALAFGRQRIYSPYIGDLHSLPMQSHFEQTLATFRDLYDLKPALLVSDRHPGYLSHQWAKGYCQEQGATHLEVQHHHAHLLGVMAEHEITGPVLGVAFDGTGLGDDGTLWGGELLLADVKGFTRVAHLKPFKLIGSEAAIREPVRQLLGLLFESYDVEQISALDIPLFNKLPLERISNLYQLWHLGRNAPYTSSIGRLFDAVAALLGVIDTPDYEGEAGLLLEAAALQLLPDETPFPLTFGLSKSAEGPLQIEWAELLNTLINERRKSTSTASLAAGFIHAVSALVIALAECFPGYPVALGGGVFQNRVLMDQLVPALEAAGRQVLTSETLPLNDGGIAAGQLWFAIHHIATHQPVTTACATLSES